MSKRHYTYYDKAGAPEEFDNIHFSGAVGEFFRSSQEEQVLSLIDANGTTVLDVGTGTGRIAIPLARKGAQVVGVDASTEMLRYARENARDLSNLSFEIADAHNLPFQSNAFDYVVSFRTLMHFKDWPLVISEMCRVSKKYVIIDFPPTLGAAVIEAVWHKALHIFHPATQAHQTFLVSEISKAFGDNNFEPVTVERQIVLPFKLHRMINRIRFTINIESMLKSAGITKVIGSPVLIKSRRVDGTH